MIINFENVTERITETIKLVRVFIQKFEAIFIMLSKIKSIYLQFFTGFPYTT